MRDELYHYGTIGMHWGKRNYQNEDGSYKPGAEGRYYTPVSKRRQKRLYKDIVKSVNSNKYNATNAAISRHMDKIMTMDDRMRISQKYIDKHNAQLLEIRQKGEPYSKEVRSIADEYDKEVEEYVNRVLGKYADKKIKNLHNDRDARSFVQEYIRNQAYEDSGKLSRAKKIESDHNNITTQIAKNLTKDPIVQKSVQKQISNQIKEYSKKGYNEATESWKDGTISFTIDGAKEIADGQGLEVFYNPATKKVTKIYWA